MPSLPEQRLIIQELEQATARNRTRLIESCRTIRPPVETVMVTAGTILIVVKLATGFAAVAKLFSQENRPTGQWPGAKDSLRAVAKLFPKKR